MNDNYRQFGQEAWAKVAAHPLGSITKRELELILLQAGIDSGLLASNAENLATCCKIPVTRAHNYLTDLALRKPALTDAVAVQSLVGLLKISEIVQDAAYFSIPLQDAGLRIWLEQKMALLHLNSGETIRRDRFLGEIDAVNPRSALVATSANVYDVTQATALMHGKETKFWADSGYRGIDKRPEARDLPVHWKVAIMPGKRKNLDTRNPIGALLEAVEKAKARTRAIGEHLFHYIKNVFGLKMVRFKGLANNTTQLFSLFGLVNLLIAKRRLLSFNTQGAS